MQQLASGLNMPTSTQSLRSGFFSHLPTLEAPGHLPKPIKRRGNRTPSQLTAGQVNLSKPQFLLLWNETPDTYHLFQPLWGLKEMHRETGLWARTQVLMNPNRLTISKKWILFCSTVLLVNKAIFTKMWRSQFNSILFSLYKNKSIWSFHLKSILFCHLFLLPHSIQVRRGLISGRLKFVIKERRETREKATEVRRQEKVLK